MFWTEQARNESKIKSGLKNICGRSQRKRRLKLQKNPRVFKRASHIHFDFAEVLENLMQVGNGFVRYRYQQRSSFMSRWFGVVDRQVIAGRLRDGMAKLPQQEKSVGQNSKAKETENDI